MIKLERLQFSSGIDRLDRDGGGAKGVTTMELRKHPLMTYRGAGNWPPAWTWLSGKKNTLWPSGEVGTLVDVAPSKIDPDGKCFLTIEHEGTSYVGCLLFDDGPFCQQISKLMQRHLRYPLEYIGGIDLRYGLDHRTTLSVIRPDPIASPLKRAPKRR